ncbi:hypothetical protein XENTR_v10003002 [Xenopus tropicalis]|uniref:LIF receptor subunit alpha n=1 Tax=Xenopus tropicalis TaxID=8364 RepID=F7EN87_XENTR|nr:leukemia inhibitory factor receptor isoform X1 [Xenopus tropicalis]KAE8636455.1 hypothetical protein XENTR_v10003002 [Xenopus tropicalis]KAE8636456.1 hypothetical protein XENTR_v10003002 [Xenopus tropicalis]
MKEKLHCCLLLAVVFCWVPSPTKTQDSPGFFQNLQCFTHNLETLVCSWDTPNATKSDILYQICYSASKPPSCFNTSKSALEVEFETIAPLRITIKASNVQGTPEITFQKTMQDIPFIPPAPEILSVVPDHQTDTLLIQWSVDNATLLSEVEVLCEILILRSENMDIVSNATWKKRWTPSDTAFYWNWTSDFPLLCTSHSVQIRCLINDQYYYGEKGWSNWSRPYTVYGSTEEKAYPTDKVVPVGTNMTFCCTVQSGTKIMSAELGNDRYPLIPLSSNSSAVRIQNMTMSEESGDNLIFYTDVLYVGTVVFVGYPPDIPQNLSCETMNLRQIGCQWNPGRITGLYGERETIYTLRESYSGKLCVACDNTEEQYSCKCDVSKGQSLYAFSLQAQNPLGKSQASLSFNVTYRVHPKAPENIKLVDISPTEVSLTWFLDGNFVSLKLICEIEVRTSNKEKEMRNTTVIGSEDGNYSYIIDNLHPFYQYDVRIRCATLDPFWKWSNWRAVKGHITLPAAPANNLDIWLVNGRHLGGRTVTVYWKHLPINEANGKIHSYMVSWKPIGSHSEPQTIVLAAFHNRTQIQLDSGDDGNYEITVVANNSAGLSPPSRITTVQLASEDATAELAVGNAEGINITWQSDANATCGYIVQWKPTSPLDTSAMRWKRFHTNASSCFISADQFPVGVRYNITVFSCSEGQHQQLKRVTGYTEELAPRVAPNFTVLETTSNSICVKWEGIPEEDLRGFLRGYVVYIVKQENTTSASSFIDIADHADPKNKKINITNPEISMLKIKDLQSGTSYRLGLLAYTGAGNGPIKSSNVVTNDNALGLILAILIPIVVAVVLGIVASTICYQKREWIKETFYPDIPNPENSKALQFQKNVNEANQGIKTMEMNPCTPNNVEVVETFSTVPKILDTELHSPVTEDPNGQTPEEDFDTEDENHVVVSYCPPSTNEDTGNLASDESASSSQVVYIDIQSMYQPQANSEEEPDGNCIDSAGYKPQMQLAINTVNMEQQPLAEEGFAAGYRPQENPSTWAVGSADSPTSLGSNSENASFGSPCSITSRHFLIPPVDDKDNLKPTHVGWSLSSLFQNKQEE